MYYLYEVKDVENIIYIVAENERAACDLLPLQPTTNPNILKENDFIIMYDGVKTVQPQLIRDYLKENPYKHIVGQAFYQYGRFSHGTVEIIDASAKIPGQFTELYYEI